MGNFRPNYKVKMASCQRSLQNKHFTNPSRQANLTGYAAACGRQQPFAADGGTPPEPPDGCKPSVRPVAAIRRSLVEINLLRRERAASGALCVVVMTPRGFHYVPLRGSFCQARVLTHGALDKKPLASNGINARGGVRVFCLSVWGCLLCWLLSFVCRCLLARCCRGRGCFRLGLLPLGSLCGVVLPLSGGVVVVGRLGRLWCRRRVFLSGAFAGGLRRGGLSGVVSGCRLRLALVAVGGAVLCLSGLPVAVAFEGGCAGGGGVGCRPRLCKKILWLKDGEN